LPLEIDDLSTLKETKITGSGVHHLCLSLWPNFSPTSSSKQKALKNLEFIIRKQYDSLVKYRDIVLLPAAFGEKDVEIFSLEARSDLYAHFLGEGHIGKAKEFFKTQVTANLCPDSVGRYWKHVFPSMTALPVICRILLPPKQVLNDFFQWKKRCTLIFAIK